MAKQGNALRRTLLVLTCIVLTACGRGSDKEPRSTELSGPVGTEFSVHPRHEADDRLLIPGCCTFDVGRARVTKLEGDVDGRMIDGKGYRIEISFGNGLGRRPLSATHPSALDVDGVTLRKFKPARRKAGEPDLLYAAIVPLNAEAQRRRVKDPGIEVKAWCATTESCKAATQVIEGLRF